jgi:hypothetical protein
MAGLSEAGGLEIRSLATSDGELVLTLRRVPVPEPAADEVVIRVEATPINPSDMGWLFGSGSADMETARESGTAEEPVLTFKIPAQSMAPSPAGSTTHSGSATRAPASWYAPVPHPRRRPCWARP